MPQANSKKIIISLGQTDIRFYYQSR